MDCGGKPSLLTAIALVAMAVAAPSAFGQIEVKTEPNPGKHCTALVVNDHLATGGCLFHFVSTQNIALMFHSHPAEQTLAVCTNEIEGRVDEAGAGVFYSVVLQDVSPGSCPIEPCRETNNVEVGDVGQPLAHGSFELWPFQIKKVGTTRVVELILCIQVKGTPEVENIPCTLHIPFINVGHTYTFFTVPDVGCEASGDEREFSGRWTFENAGEAGHTLIEILG